MKLTIELVPISCWYANLRNMVSKEAWDILRRKSYQEAGHRCSVCGATGKLFAHEVWEYDDVELIQRLVRFEARCELCHLCNHIGFAGIEASEGKLDMADVISHFIKVNECSREEFEEHERLAWELWEKRSSNEWRCELGDYEKLIKPGCCSESGEQFIASSEQIGNGDTLVIEVVPEKVKVPVDEVFNRRFMMALDGYMPVVAEKLLKECQDDIRLFGMEYAEETWEPFIVNSIWRSRK